MSEKLNLWGEKCIWISESLISNWHVSFCFNVTQISNDSTSLYKTWWPLLAQSSMFQRASCDVTECLTFSISMCPPKCSMRFRSGDCGNGQLDQVLSSASVLPSTCSEKRCKILILQVQGKRRLHFHAAIWTLLHKKKQSNMQCDCEDWMLWCGWWKCPTPEQAKHPQVWILALWRSWLLAKSRNLD